MNTQPILTKIKEDAQMTIGTLMQEAENRALTIFEQSEQSVADMREKTQESARNEGEQLDERMRRLAALEDRKNLLTAQRTLLDKAFAQALFQLRTLPAEQFGPWVLSLIVLNAEGKERVRAGELNDGFFTADFVERVNTELISAGKIGKMIEETPRVPGVTGVVLFGQGSEIYCTAEAALEQSRISLETKVAERLFPG